MCRIAARLGTPVSPAWLLYDAPHSLDHQAHAPREQLHGTVNVDGTGLAWWPSADGPARYASTVPPWSDANLQQLAPHLVSHALVAAVRGATPGQPIGREAVAPFVTDGLAIAHNGWIGDFAGELGSRLLATVDPARLAGLRTVTDSTFLTARIAGKVAAGRTLDEAVASTVREVATAARTAGQPATLNIVACDGTRLVATRYSADGPTNSLYLRIDDGATLMASEPLEAAGWTAVAPDHLVVATACGVRSFPLEQEGDR